MKKLVIESLNEGFASEESRKLDRIFEAIGYSDFEDFIADNPGCFTAIVEWIDQYFGEQLSTQFDSEELENMDLYGAADMARENEEYTDEDADEDNEDSYGTDKEGNINY